MTTPALFDDMNSINWKEGRALLIMIVLCFSSCNRISTTDRMLIERQDEIVEVAQQKNPTFKAFADKFDQTKSFISYITGNEGPPTWNSKAPLYGRYVIEMKVPVSIDRDTLEVNPIRAVTIEIREIVEVAQHPGEMPRILYGNTNRLTAQEVARLITDGETLEKLGIVLNTHNPTPGFNDYLAY